MKSALDTMREKGYNYSMTKTWSWLKINGVSSSGEMQGEEEVVPCGGERTIVLEGDKDDTGSVRRFHAMKGARLNIIRVCNKSGDIFIKADENAIVTYSEVYLYNGIASSKFIVDLDGKNASFTSNAAYMAGEGDVIDIDHSVRHNGEKTISNMAVAISLFDNARKIYRGTIDFRKGCMGAIGHEREEVIMMNEKANSRSLPVILCDEEDVEGDHGATCGRIDDAELFYMQSRGIEIEEAKKIVCAAQITRVSSIIRQYDKDMAEKIDNMLSAI